MTTTKDDSAALKTNPLDTLLLKDYHPHSNLVTPVTKIRGAKFPAFDAHCHGIRHGIGGKPTPEEIDHWAELLVELNVKKSVVLTGAVGDEFKEQVDLYSKHPDMFDLWCGLAVGNLKIPKRDIPERMTKELENCVVAGAKGVGELGDKGDGCWGGKATTCGIHYNDPRFDMVFAKCAELGIPVSLHMGDPVWTYQKIDGVNEALFKALRYSTYGTGLPGWEEISRWRDEVLHRNPRTTFILCHLANMEHDLASVGKLLDAFPNAYADISARFRDLARQPRFAKAFIVKYQDRLTYGTDQVVNKDMYLGTFRILETADEYFTPMDGRELLWMAYGLDLPDNVLKKLYYEVAEKIMSRR